MTRSIIALALAAALPLSAQAGEISYKYIEAGYASNHLDLGGGSGTLDGYDVKGSVAFNDSFYGNFSYTSGSKNSVDLDETVVGVGYRTAISDKADFNASLSWVHDNLDINNFGSASDDGYRVAVGVRGMLADKFEGNFNVNYTDAGDFGNGVGAGIGALVHINDTWGITAGYDYSNRDSIDLSTWNLGVRASF